MQSQTFTLTRSPTTQTAGGRESYTRGVLVCPDGHRFFSLEDEDRQLELHPERKVYGKTAIPRGRYKLEVAVSPRFGKPMTRVIGVNGYSGVLIHGGNKAEDSEGCVLVGTHLTTDGIANCAPAVDYIRDAVSDAAELGIESYLEVL